MCNEKISTTLIRDSLGEQSVFNKREWVWIERQNVRNSIFEKPNIRLIRSNDSKGRIAQKSLWDFMTKILIFFSRVIPFTNCNQWIFLSQSGFRTEPQKGDFFTEKNRILFYRFGIPVTVLFLTHTKVSYVYQYVFNISNWNFRAYILLPGDAKNTTTKMFVLLWTLKFE